MRICPICKGAINKGQSIAVSSAPLEAIDNNANYAIGGDFIRNEVVTHNKCFLNSFPIMRLLTDQGDSAYTYVKPEKAPMVSNLNSSVQETLAALGEKASQGEIQTFLMQNSQTDKIDEL